MFKKIFISILILSLVGALILYFFGSSILGKSVKTIVETVGTEVTQTPVRLDTVKLSILSGNGKLSGLYVGNPKGFSSENIFALSQIEIDLESRTLTSDEIVINKIYIKEPHVSYEKKLTTSNLKELLKNIEESTGGGETTEPEEQQTEAPAEEETSAPGKNILIKELIIENPNVFLGLMGVGQTITLPSIELTNISSSEEKIAGTILEKVIAEIFKGIKSATPGAAGNFIDSTKKPLQDVNDGIKGLFGK